MLRSRRRSVWRRFADSTGCRAPATRRQSPISHAMRTVVCLVVVGKVVSVLVSPACVYALKSRLRSVWRRFADSSGCRAPATRRQSPISHAMRTVVCLVVVGKVVSVLVSPACVYALKSRLRSVWRRFADSSGCRAPATRRQSPISHAMRAIVVCKVLCGTSDCCVNKSLSIAGAR